MISARGLSRASRLERSAMRVEWYGQSAFALSTPKVSVAIDPFNDLAAALSAGGVRFEYPLITGLEAQLLLVTHEHPDHNGVEAIGGDPVIVRSTAGRLPSPLGEVTAIASEHDDQAGTARGPNTIFVFELDGLRICHMGDFGQRTLREEQTAAIGAVDLLFIPVGGGPTIGAPEATRIVSQLAPRWVVPMHYRTPRIGFLETADAFLEQHASHVRRVSSAVFETAQLPVEDAPIVVVPAAP
jgi:L-ascorbate metabolism protein UlaG (beta-lactamase superfamily)